MRVRHRIRPVNMACCRELDHGPDQDRNDDRERNMRAEVRVIIMPCNDSAHCLTAQGCVTDISGYCLMRQPRRLWIAQAVGSECVMHLSDKLNR